MELIGLKGASAWQVYNKVVFHLPFIRAYNHHRRDFAAEVAAAIHGGEEAQREFLLTLSDPDIPSFRPASECIAEFKSLPLDERAHQLMECLVYAGLTDDETLRLLACHKNSRGVSYSRVTIDQLTIAQILPMALETLLTASMIDVDLSMVTGAELESLDGCRLDIRQALASVLAAGPATEAGEAIAIAAKKAFEGVPHGRG